MMIQSSVPSLPPVSSSVTAASFAANPPVTSTGISPAISPEDSVGNCLNYSNYFSSNSLFFSSITSRSTPPVSSSVTAASLTPDPPADVSPVTASLEDPSSNCLNYNNYFSSNSFFFSSFTSSFVTVASSSASEAPNHEESMHKSNFLSTVTENIYLESPASQESATKFTELLNVSVFSSASTLAPKVISCLQFSDLVGEASNMKALASELDISPNLTNVSYQIIHLGRRTRLLAQIP
jgi:hypothetical protein